MMPPARQDADNHNADRFMPITPDPTAAVAAAVEAATDVNRRELRSLRETLETRLNAADEDRGRVWERLRDLPALYEQFTVHLRDEMFRQDEHNRAMLSQRLEDLDSARLRDGRELAAELEHRRREYEGNLASSQDLTGQRLSGMDRALELMAAETARALAAADASDKRDREEMSALVTALRELLGERIDGIDKATELLAANVDKIASDIDKSAAGLKAITDTRLAGMDEATKLLAVNVDKVPYAILQEAGNLKSFIMSRIEDVSHVSDEKFNAVDALFASNALALAAALAAQEKAVAAQNDSNTLAISKSESSTKETIAANAAQAQTANSSLAAQVTDIKERVVRIESSGAGVASVTGTPFDAGLARQAEAVAEGARQRAVLAMVISGILLLVTLASVVFAITKK